MWKQCFTAVKYMCEWITMFKHSHTSVTDEWSGHPSTSATEENTEWVCAMILGKRWVTLNEVVHNLCNCNGSVYGIIQDQLGFHKFVQDGFQNDWHESIGTTIWQSAKACWTAIIRKVTLFWDGDKTWIHYYASKSQCHSMEWKHLILPVETQFKT